MAKNTYLVDMLSKYEISFLTFNERIAYIQEYGKLYPPGKVAYDA
jgi:hypothetical protein